MYSKSLADELEKIKSRYPNSESALLPALHAAQREFGWLSLNALKAVADILDIPEARVKGVATFHAMYQTKPSGKHLIQLCTNVSCMLFGAETLLFILKEKYGLEPGGTSKDGRYSLQEMECLGQCDGPPAMLVDRDAYTNLNASKLIEILESYT